MSTYIDCFRLTNKIPDTPVVIQQLESENTSLLSANRNLKLMLMVGGVALVSYVIYQEFQKDKERRKRLV